MKPVNIVIAGVGGQGSLLASKILGALLMAKGMDVKVNEVHGMSQRGGSVVTMVKGGECIASPVVEPGTADYLIGLELTETMRAASFLKPEGKAVCSDMVITPAGAQFVPDLTGIPATVIDAVGIAKSAGDARTANTALLGALSCIMEDTAVEEWREAIKRCCKPAVWDVNLCAFDMGRTAWEKGR